MDVSRWARYIYGEFRFRPDQEIAAGGSDQISAGIVLTNIGVSAQVVAYYQKNERWWRIISEMNLRDDAYKKHYEREEFFLEGKSMRFVAVIHSWFSR